MRDGEVADITPQHEPISLAREMVEHAPGCAADVCVLVRPNGSMWCDMAGHRRADAMWALQRMIPTLMERCG